MVGKHSNSVNQVKLTKTCVCCNSEFITLSKKSLFCHSKDQQHKLAKRKRSNDLRNIRRTTIGLYNSDIIKLNKQRQKTIRRRYWLNKYKSKRGCDLCKFNKHPIALHFDHIDPMQKSFIISRAASTLPTYKLHLIFEEIRKCRLLCSNCHAIESFEQGHHFIVEKLLRIK